MYFDTPNVAIAVNFKVASASIARAVIETYHPEIEALITNPAGNGTGTAYPAGKSADTTRWHGLCPKVDAGDCDTVALLVRHPVERFASSCAESQVNDIDAKLTELESCSFVLDPHFWHQHIYATEDSCLYLFPDHLAEFEKDMGFKNPLKNITGGNKTIKPILTESQIARVEVIYAEDMKIYNQLLHKYD